MAITLKGTRIASINVNRKPDNGQWEFSGNYELVTEGDVVLAKQTYNGYDGLKIGMNPEIAECVKNLSEALNKNLNAQLGT